LSRATAVWDSGDAYEQYVGRWSRTVATELLRWLAPRSGLAWADVGCGTGALASTILTMCDPSSISGIDSSEGFVSLARQRISDPRARFETGDATHLPWNSAVRDVTAAGLVLNFVRDHSGMVREMARVTRPGGTVAAYVWDYAGGMQMMRRFWDAAIAVSPNDAKLDRPSNSLSVSPGQYLESRLAPTPARPIELTARAWAVRGVV
jgi:trans-aconitate methyltransferase